MQRYKVRCHDCDPEIIPHEAGKWVRWGDVERLRAELAECIVLLDQACTALKYHREQTRPYIKAMKRLLQSTQPEMARGSDGHSEDTA